MSEPNDIPRQANPSQLDSAGSASASPDSSASVDNGAPEFPAPDVESAPLSHSPPSTGSVPSASAAERLSVAASGPRPTFLFFGIVSAISLVADVTTKAWAEIELSKRTILDPSIVLIPNHLSFTLAYNKGGAWGLLASSAENIRRPFFLLVSALAIGFIVSLYGRLAPNQRALKWGLPLVLGGALGNLSDRITRTGVIDFIDYRADWIESMNRLVGKVFPKWGITDHWPTFNVADISICIGVGLMAIDMFTSKRSHGSVSVPPPAPTPPRNELTPPPTETAPAHQEPVIAPEAKPEPPAS